jgi:response regulator RpfG family c-di-GMP phosphodiesterase
MNSANTDIQILFVDDEINILKTLKRLMTFEEYQCHFAISGQKAIEILQQTPCDVIISDMRMPAMMGDAFMIKARELCPNSIRFIMSGYSDFNSMIHALNEGGVHQFLKKPWDDNILLEKIREAASFITVRKERDHLAEVTKQQAFQLAEANKNLEAKVAARTQELQQTADMLDLSFTELKRSYDMFIDVIAQVLQLRTIAPKDHLNDISDTALALAVYLKLDEHEQETVYQAAKLHELGKVRMRDSTLANPYFRLTGLDLNEYRGYPLQGYSLMASLDHLSDVSNLIKFHCEQFDGKGFPNHIKGEEIPIGARIIAVAMHFFMYRNGLADGNIHSDTEAEKYLRSIAGKEVDPELVEPFLECVKQEFAKKGKYETMVTLEKAATGMVLSRDLYNVRGIIMLTKGAVLTEKIISKLDYIASKEKHKYVLYIENLSPEEDAD